MLTSFAVAAQPRPAVTLPALRMQFRSRRIDVVVHVDADGWTEPAQPRIDLISHRIAATPA